MIKTRIIKQNPNRLPLAAIWASLAGLLLTHGIVIACLLYCTILQPEYALLDHRHHHGHHSVPVMSHTDLDHWQTGGSSSPILAQGSELPLAVAALLIALAVVRATRRVFWTPPLRFASWIVPLIPPPPRM